MYGKWRFVSWPFTFIANKGVTVVLFIFGQTPCLHELHSHWMILHSQKCVCVCMCVCVCVCVRELAPQLGIYRKNDPNLYGVLILTE